MLVSKRTNCQYRYGAAHYRYWYQFWYRLPHTRKFTSSHLSYFVNFVLATLLRGIYHTLSLSSLSLAYCTLSISPSRVVTVQLCRPPTPLQATATSSHLRRTHTSLETQVPFPVLALPRWRSFPVWVRAKCPYQYWHDPLLTMANICCRY